MSLTIGCQSNAKRIEEALRDFTSHPIVMCTKDCVTFCSDSTYNPQTINDAILKYGEVLKISPKHLKTQINLGAMYMNMNPPEADAALSLFLNAYEIDKNNNNKLVVDIDAAIIVKEIYNLYLKGLGYTSIAKYLNNKDRNGFGSTGR